MPGGLVHNGLPLPAKAHGGCLRKRHIYQQEVAAEWEEVIKKFARPSLVKATESLVVHPSSTACHRLPKWVGSWTVVASRRVTVGPSKRCGGIVEMNCDVSLGIG